MTPMKSLATRLAIGIAAATLLTGCYTPSGGFNPGTGRGFVYISTPTRPVTITLVDTRNGEPFFKLDIPAGEQLTFKFVEGSGTGSRIEPTKMMWAVWEAKTEFGSLNNQLICPPASCRRIDVSFRPAPEDPPTDPTLLIAPDSVIPTAGPESPAGGPQTPNRPQD